MKASLQAARKARKVRTTATKSGILDAPTNLKEFVTVSDAVLESKPIAEYSNGFMFHVEKPEFRWTRSSQVTDDIGTDLDVELDAENPSQTVTDAVGEDTRPV